jgi:Lon protease-like protein
MAPSSSPDEGAAIFRNVFTYRQLTSEQASEEWLGERVLVARDGYLAPESDEASQESVQQPNATDKALRVTSRPNMR